jgi:hypothetical protein
MDLLVLTDNDSANDDAQREQITQSKITYSQFHSIRILITINSRFPMLNFARLNNLRRPLLRRLKQETHGCKTLTRQISQRHKVVSIYVRGRLRTL